jgi:hypothetical protein
LPGASGQTSAAERKQQKQNAKRKTQYAIRRPTISAASEITEAAVFFAHAKAKFLPAKQLHPSLVKFALIEIGPSSTSFATLAPISDGHAFPV